MSSGGIGLNGSQGLLLHSGKDKGWRMKDGGWMENVVQLQRGGYGVEAFMKKPPEIRSVEVWRYREGQEGGLARTNKILETWMNRGFSKSYCWRVWETLSGGFCFPKPEGLVVERHKTSDEENEDGSWSGTCMGRSSQWSPYPPFMGDISDSLGQYMESTLDCGKGFWSGSRHGVEIGVWSGKGCRSGHKGRDPMETLSEENQTQTLGRKLS
ncbi:uncharacterized protein BJ212DRAFT_1304111 [Suillus subaureus]|uniref:Uncharacterized protein n=1 Tax=Suillus subaureus TaxID=48587 RepID=A0A9P7DWW2_9AGAM|nr:uncharacterized protein BJ212DRAFT_1304111 [Suillus subaureus]KAG1805327.1 hypothetical protein BJ212DRAFT_1304111 [Suillus subaureus]